MKLTPSARAPSLPCPPTAADPVCLSLMLSKCLSYAMLLSGAIIKVPQILIILKNRRAAGLSLMSLVMELVCYSISITYSYRRGFAFSSYGETALIAVQDISLIFLVLALSNRLGLLALSPVLLGLWGAFMFFATGDMLKLMQVRLAAGHMRTTPRRLPIAIFACRAHIHRLPIWLPPVPPFPGPSPMNRAPPSLFSS